MNKQDNNKLDGNCKYDLAEEANVEEGLHSER